MYLFFFFKDSEIVLRMTLLGTYWVLGVGDPEVHKAQPFLLPPTPSFVFSALHSVCAGAVAAGDTLRPLNAGREAHFQGGGIGGAPGRAFHWGENLSVEGTVWRGTVWRGQCGGDSLGAGFLPPLLF